MTYSNFEPSGSDGTSNLHTIEPHAAAQNRALSSLKARGLAVDFDRNIFNNVAAPARRRTTLRGLGYAGRAIIIIYIGLDAIIFPMFRPSSRWLGGRAVVHAAQRRVGRLPAYVILALLALPFAIAEPAKILAVYLMTTGHAFIGTLVLAGAYFISLVIVERLFRGGRAKLLTIPWFKNAWRWLMGVRRDLLKRGRSTRLWMTFVKSRDRVRRHVHVARFRRFGRGGVGR
jgi:hypothetical protein